MSAVEQLPGLVLSLSRSLTAISTDALVSVDADVTPNQYHALEVLDQHEQMSVAYFARCCAIDRSTATRLCDRLVKKGLVARERSYRDRRSVNVVLTEHAHRLLQAVSLYRIAKINQVIGDVPEQDYPHLAESLELLSKAATRTVESEKFALH